MNESTRAALKLHDYIFNTHWNGNALIGPDPEVRFNARIWRFPKSYLRSFPWRDDRYFLQCQGYWIRDNWKLYSLFRDEKYKTIALTCSQKILTNQQPGGYWEYPLPQWKERIATVEGNYAALGLLASYNQTREQSFLEGALRWYNFLIKQTGFQTLKDTLAISYFSGQGRGGMVPNNSTLTLEFFAELYRNTQDEKYLAYCREMVKFLKTSQLNTGELPYALQTPWDKGKTHFLCFQYNAFQFLDLARYWEMTRDETVYELLKNLIRYLVSGLHEKGHAKYDCRKSYPEVTYYTAVLGAAFLKATKIGLGDYTLFEDKAYHHLLKKQNMKGGFIYSNCNYGIFHDKRSYPRYLAMILLHLLMKAESSNSEGL